jgi:non-ribosomal peptide synthetase-like protein
MMAHGIVSREFDFASTAATTADMLSTDEAPAGAAGTASPATATDEIRAPVLTVAGGQPRAGLDDRLELLFEETARRHESRDAVVTDARVWSYRDIDEAANRMARVLIDRGVRPGDRIGLLLDRTVETYVGLLAVMKAKASWVPLATAFPADRIAYILEDAAITMVVSISLFEDRLGAFGIPYLLLDRLADEAAAKPATALGPDEVGAPVDRICYILYTSGTTGNPKGVVIEHPSICNFVRVAAETYGYRSDDRVYQGMTIAFDFSIEEIWVPFMSGSAVVPGAVGMTLLGEELAEFLRSRHITCMACSPTLLATIETEVPLLRILLVGGEACPHNLVVRWYRAGRRILNSYGPTEATVTATLTELTPDKPVTIGVPLPSYAIVILDPSEPKLMPAGEKGEIGIAGICLAVGYLNRPDLTEAKFIPDFVGVPHNPSARIYRTGDIGRVNDDGEVEYHGRIDTQVKIRGHRIELGEIESVLLDQPAIHQAAVTTFEPEPGNVQLVGYFAVKGGMAVPSRQELVQAMKARLPDYMVPAWLEQLDVIPMTVSNKADHRRLPPPKSARIGSERPMVAPTNDEQRVLAAVLCEVLSLSEVSVEDHFFDELGANSLLMARFCARLRARPDFPPVSMRDVYLAPTIVRLAEHLARPSAVPAVETVAETFHEPSAFAYWGTGVLQAAFYAVYGYVTLWAFDIGLGWVYDALDDWPTLYLRCIVVGAGSFFGMSFAAIAAKWLLIGRWKVETFPIWSLRYFRFWVVTTMMRTAPVVLFKGSPLYSLYLQLLGAHIGRNAVVECRHVPVCTDLIAIGDNSIIRKESMVLGYRAQGNHIRTGHVTIGANAFVGEAAVLDIDTEIGDGAQLGHASSLQSGQRIAAGERAHGSPAVPTTADYCRVPNEPCSPIRRVVYEAFQLITLFAVAMPLPLLALSYWEKLAETADEDGGSGRIVFASLVLLVVGLGGAIFGAVVVPRLTRPFLQPGRVYTLYGLNHWLQAVTATVSNSRILNVLFGDSSAVVHYIRAIGWNLNEVEQTGSNFGTNQMHDNPLYCEIGSRTMVSDGLSMINLEKSASSFRLAHTKIGERNYLGNNIHYPPDGKTGANVLLATKVMVPIDGEVRENVGLLGSPAFEIPRMVDRDKSLIGALDEPSRRRRLARKNLHNLVTALMFLTSQWFMLFMSLWIWDTALDLYFDWGAVALYGALVVTAVTGVLYYALIERASLGFRSLKPRIATIYDPYFWSHERHWKMSDTPIMGLFLGTPFRPLILRMIGVKVGKRVWDGGCIITERSLAEIGDFANLNESAVIQSHSLEEGAFKSDRIRIGAGCTLGPAAFVHYGVTLEEHAVLEADAFLMKGETVEAYGVWRGNPAKLHHRLKPATVTTSERVPAGYAEMPA